MIEKDWTTGAGLRAVVIMHSELGHRCGYVGVPDTHPLFEANYGSIPEDYDLTVHGGLTYSGNGDYPVPSDLWWFGYDCGHLGDAAAPGSLLARFAFGGVHRTLEYCENECESLAKQLKEMK
jgi:hypothetical protein